MKERVRGIIVLYLNFWAKSILKRFRPYVIGITGSSGKTTTKYFVSKLLDASGKSSYVSTSNLNTKYGLPLAVLLIDNAPSNVWGWLFILLILPFRSIMLKKYPDFLVLEYAADQPGDIKMLTELVAPDIAVITSIGVAHIEIFKSEQNIIAEKSYLLEKTKEYAIVSESVYDKINPHNISARIVISQKVPFLKFDKIVHKTKGTELEISLGGKSYKKMFLFAGEHNLNNLRLAILACYFAGAGVKMLNGIEDLKPLPGRGERFLSKDEIMVIDETYNANPESMLAALNNLASIKYGRKVAILGEMKEIGPISSAAHLEIAKIAKRISDVTIGVGDGFKNCELDKWYPSVRELKENFGDIIKSGDVVLVKGSRSNKLEEVIEILK